MKAEAQWYLVEQLSMARGLLGIRDDYEAKQNAMAHFAGVLAAFRYVEDLTQDEEHAWYRRMLVAMGYEPLEPRRQWSIGHEAAIWQDNGASDRIRASLI